jgi:homoserine dehydrogenase
MNAPLPPLPAGHVNPNHLEFGLTDVLLRLSPSLANQHPSGPALGVGLLGLGTVGRGVFRLIQRHSHLQVRGVLVRDVTKDRQLPQLTPELLTTRYQSIVENPDIAVVVEVAGGIEEAKVWVEAALRHKKHVVTANKALIATHGPALFALAQANGVSLLFEAAVAGGIPLLLPLQVGLAANRILEIAGILNGTTNYILTRMTQEGTSFETALAQAQALGFAEADPTSDVGGQDAAYKLAILAAMAFKQSVAISDVYMEGITAISSAEMDYAKRFDYVIKLIGLARWHEDTQDVELRVHPMLVKKSHPLASVNNEYNAVWINSDAAGDTMFYGKGAGELPTASAVMGDLLTIASDVSAGNTTTTPASTLRLHQQAKVLPIGQTRNRYYIRLNTQDEPGVLARLGEAFGSRGVSLESFLQLPGATPATASLMVVTHEAQEQAVQAALEAIKQQPSTLNVGCVLRVL